MHRNEEQERIAAFITSDGHVMDSTTVSCLIGASLPTEAACREAVGLLYIALAHHVSLGDLWELSRIAVWVGLEAARGALKAVLAGQALIASAAPLPPTGQLAWSEQIVWDDESPPVPATTAQSDGNRDDFERSLAQLSLL